MRVCGVTWQLSGLDAVEICMLVCLVGFPLIIRVGLFLPMCVCGSSLSCFLLLVSLVPVVDHCCVVVLPV